MFRKRTQVDRGSSITEAGRKTDPQTERENHFKYAN